MPDEAGLQAADAVIEYGRRLNADGLAIGPAGNISVRVGVHIAISPSQIPYESVTRETVCFVDLAGAQVGGAAQPSSELGLHLKLYRETDARAVVHTHSPRAVALSTVRDVIPAVHYCVLRLGGDDVRVAPYRRFGSAELAEVAVEAARGRCAAVLQNHGTVTHGRSLAEAYERAQLLEFLAGVYLDACTLGEPRILTSDELRDVNRERDRRAALR